MATPPTTLSIKHLNALVDGNRILVSGEIEGPAPDDTEFLVGFFGHSDQKPAKSKDGFFATELSFKTRFGRQDLKVVACLKSNPSTIRKEAMVHIPPNRLGRIFEWIKAKFTWFRIGMAFVGLLLILILFMFGPRIWKSAKGFAGSSGQILATTSNQVSTVRLVEPSPGTIVIQVVQNGDGNTNSTTVNNGASMPAHQTTAGQSSRSVFDESTPSNVRTVSVSPFNQRGELEVTAMEEKVVKISLAPFREKGYTAVLRYATHLTFKIAKGPTDALVPSVRMADGMDVVIPDGTDILGFIRNLGPNSMHEGSDGSKYYVLTISNCRKTGVEAELDFFQASRVASR